MESEGLITRQQAQEECKCFSCKHLIEWPYCFAFLTGEGIPEDIRLGREDHTVPHPGDHGMVFTPLSSLYELSEEGMRWLMSEYRGMTIMPHDAVRDTPETTSEFRSEEAPAHDPDRAGRSLIAAAASGDLSRARELLERGAGVNAQDSDGTTALISACRNCDMQMVELLLRHGADVNLEDNSSRTPLYIANAWGYPTIAELLKDHGAVETNVSGV